MIKTRTKKKGECDATRTLYYDNALNTTLNTCKMCAATITTILHGSRNARNRYAHDLRSFKPFGES